MGAVPVNKRHVSRRQDETYKLVDPLSTQNCKAETLESGSVLLAYLTGY